jgi:hypothetical protein
VTLPNDELERMVRAAVARLVTAEEGLDRLQLEVNSYAAQLTTAGTRIKELEGREAPANLERRLIALEGQLAETQRRQKGDKGDKGERGQRGERGRDGTDGKASDTVIREVKISG